MRRALILAAAAACVPVAISAQAFDFESALAGSSPSVVVTNGGQTLTVTPEGPGIVYIGNFGVPLLGLRSITGSTTPAIAIDQFIPIRFTFLQAVSSITFLFGDGGSDDDSPARIQAFDSFNLFLGAFDTPYGAGAGAGASRSLTFGGAGAKYFILSSGAGLPNPNSIAWEVSASTIATVSVVPEPASVALVAGGLLTIAGVARRRKSRA